MLKFKTVVLCLKLFKIYFQIFFRSKTLVVVISFKRTTQCIFTINIDSGQLKSKSFIEFTYQLYIGNISTQNIVYKIWVYFSFPNKSLATFWFNIDVFKTNAGGRFTCKRNGLLIKTFVSHWSKISLIYIIFRISLILNVSSRKILTETLLLGKLLKFSQSISYWKKALFSSFW